MPRSGRPGSGVGTDLGGNLRIGIVKRPGAGPRARRCSRRRNGRSTGRTPGGRSQPVGDVSQAAVDEFFARRIVLGQGGDIFGQGRGRAGPAARLGRDFGLGVGGEAGGVSQEMPGSGRPRQLYRTNPAGTKEGMYVLIRSQRLRRPLSTRIITEAAATGLVSEARSKIMSFSIGWRSGSRRLSPVSLMKNDFPLAGHQQDRPGHLPGDRVLDDGRHPGQLVRIEAGVLDRAAGQGPPAQAAPRKPG